MHKDSILQYDNYEEYVKAQNAGFKRKVNSHSGVGERRFLKSKNAYLPQTYCVMGHALGMNKSFCK